MHWLQQNAQELSAVASLGVLVIWSVYAWLFYQEFRRHRGPMILIHHAGGGEPGGELLLINMSQEPVHIICTLVAQEDRAVRLRRLKKHDGPASVESSQGPLKTGEYLMLGSFAEALEELRASGGPDGPGQLVEIRVAAIHGFHRSPVGARRAFRFEAGRKVVFGEGPQTEQMVSYRQRQEVELWLSVCRETRVRELQGPGPAALARGRTGAKAAWASDSDRVARRPAARGR